eukprot:Gb_35616 [translate_table: standard]
MAAKSPMKNGNAENLSSDTTLDLDEETQALQWLLDAFPSMSLKEIASAYSSANCDASRTAEILTRLNGSTTAPASFSGSLDESLENENSVLKMLPKKKDVLNQKSMKVHHTLKSSNASKPKKLTVSTGIVSSILGNGYTRGMSCQNERGTENSLNYKRKDMRKIKVDEAGMPLEMTGTTDSLQERQVEDFLYSMMGDGCELDMDIVRDVLSQSEYDVQKSLDRLLDMAATTSLFQYENGSVNTSNGVSGSDKEGSIEISYRVISESFPDRDQDELLSACQVCGGEAKGDIEEALSILLDQKNLNACERKGECLTEQHNIEESYHEKSILERLKLTFPNLAEGILNEILESVNFNYSEATNVLLEAGMRSGHVENVDRSSLPRQVLESLFNMSGSSEQTSSDMDWVKAVKNKKKSKQKPVNTSLGNLSEPAGALCADGEEDEYQQLRKTATQHWSTMKSYYQEAAAAYSRGERARAGYLSEQGQFYKQIAREADEKASQRIFEFKNRDMRNDITIDLHSQHVTDAVRLLKLHIKSLACISSIHYLKVITGCGSHGTGRGRIKRAVTQFLEKEGINWTEENTGVVVIKMTDVDPHNLSFANADSDA